jgi:drug/metabolite transporter (DMT)-like permease
MTTVVGLALLILVWGTTWAAIRVGLEDLPPFTGASLRFLIAGFALLAIGRMLGLPRQRGPLLRRLWLVEWSCAFVVSYGVVYWAQQWLPSGLAAVLFSTFPLFVALLAHFLLPAEPLRWRHFVGVVIAFGGVAVISLDDLSLEGRAAFVAGVVFLISPVSAAVSHVLVKKWGAGIHPFNLVAVPMIGAGVAFATMALAVERHRSVTFDARSVGTVVYLALAGSALTFSVYYWLLERLPATRLALITYAIPIVALIVGALALDESLTWQSGLGSLCVLTGVGMALRA